MSLEREDEREETVVMADEEGRGGVSLGERREKRVEEIACLREKSGRGQKSFGEKKE